MQRPGELSGAAPEGGSQPGLQVAIEYPDWLHRADWLWHERTITTMGTVSAIAEIPRFNNSPKVLCYQSCLTSQGVNFAAFQSGEMRLEFGDESVVLIVNPDADPGGQRRWIFAKSPERDPFGPWAFYAGALETPADCRYVPGEGNRKCGP